MRNALRSANTDVSVKRLRNFLRKQKQNGNHQRRSNVDKSLASRERLLFKEVISWISKQGVELIPTVFMCWKLAFSVLVLKDNKSHNTGNADHW